MLVIFNLVSFSDYVIPFRTILFESFRSFDVLLKTNNFFARAFLEMLGLRNSFDNVLVQFFCTIGSF